MWVVGTVTFGAKRSYHTQLGTQYAVSFGAKRSTHTVYVANMGGGDHELWCKKVIPHAVGYAVQISCWCKKSTHTVYVANMGGGDCYLYGKKVIPHAVRYAVCSRCWCKKSQTVYAVRSGIVVYGGVDIAFGAKRSNQWIQWMQSPRWHSTLCDCIHWFDLFAPKTTPHHHISLFHCIHCTLCPLVWPFCTKEQCPHHHIQLFYCVHCILRPHHRVTFV